MQKKNYEQLTNDVQTLDIGQDDDGELDVVVKKNTKPRTKTNSFLLWIIVVTFLGAILIYLAQSNKKQQGSNEHKSRSQNLNFTKINKTIIPEQQFKENQIEKDGPKLIELNDDKEDSEKVEILSEESEIESEEEQKESEEEEKKESQEVDFEKMQEQSDKLKEEIKEYYQQKNETHTVNIIEASKDKRYDTILCDQGYYMNKDEKQCKKCEEKCAECMHILGTCYRCENQYYLNNYGKCIQKCEGYADSNNLLLSDDNKNQSIPICLGKNQLQSFYMTVQKSNNTHFVLPYLIIHPAYNISHLYHNSYPMVYYFNKDLFNFEEGLKLTDIAQQAQEKQLIVIVLGCHTLYDFSLFNTFLFQQAISNIEKIAKIKSSSFRAYFGQDYNAYGVIREYQAQYKNNTVDLVISDDPVEISHEYLETNLLVTHEQHYTDYNFESLQGAQSEKTTVILLFHTKNEQDTHNYCQKFEYVSFLQCSIREIQIDNYQRMKQGFELISQFVVQPDI